MVDGGGGLCARPVWDPVSVVAGLEHQTIDVRIWCVICLVFGPDIQHTFIKE